MRDIAPLLLCCFFGLMEVYSETAPYLNVSHNIMPNNSYVNLSMVRILEHNRLQCHTDLTTCCSGAQGADRGDWYFPSGTRLPFFKNNDNNVTLSEGRGNQQVILYHRGGSDKFGIYRCGIKTIAAKNNSGHESLFVGLYTNGGE